MRNLLLVVIAVALIAIAGLLYVGTRPEHTGAWQKQYREEHSTAEYLCTMNGAATTADDLNSPEYLNCVKRETATAMAAWVTDHPDEH